MENHGRERKKDGRTHAQTEVADGRRGMALEGKRREKQKGGKRSPPAAREPERPQRRRAPRGRGALYQLQLQGGVIRGLIRQLLGEETQRCHPNPQPPPAARHSRPAALTS